MRNFYQRGVTSVMVLLLMFVATVLMLSLAGLSMGSLKRSTNERDSGLNFNVAQAMLEFQLGQSYELAKNNNGEFIAMEVDLSYLADSITPGATAYVDVQPTEDPKRAWFTSYATYKGKQTSVRALVSTINVSVWSNAIFAGTGATGQAINGNVDIRGSVHLLGEGEAFSDLNGSGRWDDAEVFSDDNGNGVWDPGEPWVDANSDGVWNSAEPYNDTNWNGVYDPPIDATELSSSLSGKAHIGNNYYNMPIGLEAVIAPAPTIDGIETLGATVRVKHGMIAMSGGATIGDSIDPDGGMAKGKIDGSFVNDGYGGNQGSTNVYSDNGTNQSYDVGHLGIEFPVINGIGAGEYIDDDGVVWATHGLYMDNNSLTVPVNSIDSSTPYFKYTSAAGDRFEYTPAGSLDPETGLPTTVPIIRVEGIIKIEGNLDIANDLGELRFRGNGSLYVTQDINLHTNFMPLEGLVFPTDTVIGMIAGRDINLATGNGDAQLTMVGAYYAQGTIRSAKQNQIASTFVANFFDMGKNVPSIYQVPLLVDNMPPGMPGDVPVYTLKILSWRARKMPNVPYYIGHTPDYSIN